MIDTVYKHDSFFFNASTGNFSFPQAMCMHFFLGDILHERLTERVRFFFCFFVVFFFSNGHVKEFFLVQMMLARYLYFRITQPPPLKNLMVRPLTKAKSIDTCLVSTCDIDKTKLD